VLDRCGLCQHLLTGCGRIFMAECFFSVENVLANNSLESAPDNCRLRRARAGPKVFFCSTQFWQTIARTIHCQRRHARSDKCFLSSGMQIGGQIFLFGRESSGKQSVAEPTGIGVTSSALVEPTFLSVRESSRKHSGPSVEEQSESVRLTDPIFPLTTTV
jgi:hypothetical protein